MFLNHDAAFTTFAPARPVAQPRHTLTLSARALIESTEGWTRTDTLRVGDRIATLDGGFVPITAVSYVRDAAPMVHVPGGALSNCSDVALPADAHVALTPPACFSAEPIVSVPLRALSGWRGIRPTLMTRPDLTTLHLESEEMVFAQTGLLMHAQPDAGASFFKTLGYGDTRAMLALIEGKMPHPDQVAA